MIKSQNMGARLGLALLGAGMLLSAAPAAAQTGNPSLDGPGEALSRNLRSLAENPKSLTALMGAGKAALELGDPQAAITFFGRAEEQAPSDGRIKMWLGAALAQLQQPEGALKFFAEATSLGVPEAEVAAQRGLAYDLVGDPRRAQRDYRMALQNKPSPEITRQLALSLAISGEREPALRVIEDQLLIRDKAAERTRAFVLALTGDAAGAARAVQASMPAQSAALTPFLERLPALSLSERALAVHLGSFPSRARNLPVPRPNTYAAYEPSTRATDRAGAPDTSRPALGTRTAVPPKPAARVAARQPVPAPKAETRIVERRPAPAPARQIASAIPAEQKPKPEPTRRPQSASTSSGNSQWAWSRGVPQTRAAAPVERARPAPSPPQQQAAAKAPQTISVPVAAQQVATASAAPVIAPEQQTPAPVVEARLEPQPQGPSFASGAPIASAQVPIARTPISSAPGNSGAVMPGFSIAAVPQGERVSPPQQPVSELASIEAPPPAEAPVEERGASRLAGIASLIASLPETTPASEPAPEVASEQKAAAAPVKVIEAKKAVAAKPVPKKEVAAEKKPVVPAEPKRIWVQVAGGADKAALPREFARIKTKAPKLLAARGAWTTPLKATNRLLVGPFKTDGEAQTFVNELKKSDVTGFAWTSEAGQKIEKLSAK